MTVKENSIPGLKTPFISCFGRPRGQNAQSLGNSDFLGSKRKLGQSQFLKTFPCFLVLLYFEDLGLILMDSDVVGRVFVLFSMFFY